MSFSDFDQYCMQQALEMARHAEQQGEVPIGAVVVHNSQIIAQGWNCPISSNDPTNHAEIVVLRQAAQKINNYRLVDMDLYVTLEPCMMCIGAMLHARIKRCIFGAFDPKDKVKCDHHLPIAGGLLAEECGQLLRDFFIARR
ncbi:MAG: tRNA adenosine(34) deaminase TadA [Gammaproteobacteria bacterium]|jgi:tRNA(adenine34) deaminase